MPRALALTSAPTYSADLVVSDELELTAGAAGGVVGDRHFDEFVGDGARHALGERCGIPATVIRGGII